VEVLFTLIVVLRIVLHVPSEFFLKSSHVSMTVGFGAHAAAKIATAPSPVHASFESPFASPRSVSSPPSSPQPLRLCGHTSTRLAQRGIQNEALDDSRRG
jgi:hypothetical protein